MSSLQNGYEIYLYVLLNEHGLTMAVYNKLNLFWSMLNEPIVKIKQRIVMLNNVEYVR